MKTLNSVLLIGSILLSAACTKVITVPLNVEPLSKNNGTVIVHSGKL